MMAGMLVMSPPPPPPPALPPAAASLSHLFFFFSFAPITFSSHFQLAAKIPRCLPLPP